MRLCVAITWHSPSHIVLSRFYIPGTPHFIALPFTVHHRCCVFYKLKARTSTCNKMMTVFMAILALLRWSGTDPAISLRYIYTDLC